MITQFDNLDFQSRNEVFPLIVEQIERLKALQLRNLQMEINEQNVIRNELAFADSYKDSLDFRNDYITDIKLPEFDSLNTPYK